MRSEKKDLTRSEKSALTKHKLVDAAAQIMKEEGYVSENALEALAEDLGVETADLYDSASFYSMLRFEKPAQTEIRVCRGTACHSGGNTALVEALEAATGIRLGEGNEQYSLGWVECLGQCQAAPSMLVNGELFTDVALDRIPEILGGAK